MNSTTFLPADLLLPQDCDLTAWAVIAADQYIDQAEYWQSVEDFVQRQPSSLRLTLPESCLEGPDMETDIMSVNGEMSEYLRGNRFKHLDNALIYLERTMKSGQVRRGILGMIDLEEYDSEHSATSLIRGGERTTLPRIPPRVAVRKNAPLELSHVILMADDQEGTLFQGIDPQKLTCLYDFPLMKEGGKVQGWLLGEEEKEKVLAATQTLRDPEYFRNKYQSTQDVLQFAVGDGNHSLVTAKECYERQKSFVHPEDRDKMLSRYAMVELVNLHDPGVELLPVHLVIHGVDAKEFIREFAVAGEQLEENTLAPQEFHFHFQGNSADITVKNPLATLEVYTLQAFLPTWLNAHPKAWVSYVQQEEEALAMGEKSHTLCIIMPQYHKKDIFPSLIHQGILPVKAFTLGDADQKRFYLEARKIR